MGCPSAKGAPMVGCSSMRERTAPTASKKAAPSPCLLSSYHLTASTNSAAADAALRTFTG